MKWIYGRQDWKTLERGLENCYLLTNGLGGFSSLTMTGAVARNDHSVFIRIMIIMCGVTEKKTFIQTI